MRKQKKLGEILIDLHVLTHRDVDRVLQALRRRVQRQKFGQMAKDMGLVNEEQILAALAVQMNLFPGIQAMSLKKVLHCLVESEELPATTSPGGTAPGR